MSKEFKNRAARRQAAASGAIGSVTPNPTGAVPEKPPIDHGDPIKRFMRENPVGKIQDSPEDSGDVVHIPGQDADAVADASTVETPPAAPVAGEAPAGETPAAPEGQAGTPATEEKPAIVPQDGEASLEEVAKLAAAKPVDAAPAPAAPEKPSYNPADVVPLVEGGAEWNRGQIVDVINEWATNKPKAAEADKYRGLFGQESFDKTAQIWGPILQKLRSDQPRGAFVAELVDNVKADELQYLQESLAHYRNLSPEERGVPAGQPAQQPAGIVAPQTDRYTRTVETLHKQAVKGRVDSQWSSAFERFPFLRHNAQARATLGQAADSLREADVSNGRDELEARGLPEAIAQLAIFLEPQQAAFEAANRAPARPAAPPLPTPPAEGPQALLSSSGTAPSASRATTNQRYKGTDPVSAFRRDHG